jgi:hypothetical protein
MKNQKIELIIELGKLCRSRKPKVDRLEHLSLISDDYMADNSPTRPSISVEFLEWLYGLDDPR